MGEAGSQLQAKSDVQAEEENIEEHPPTSHLPASFKGRLNIAAYAFTPASTQSKNLSSPVRRSPRAQSHPLKAPLPVPGSLKRKHTSLSPSPSSPKKKLRSPSVYKDPKIYSHLPPLPDVIVPNLTLLFIGLNPGISTSKTGHAYAHPSNLFWKLLYSSGCTTRRLDPTEDGLLPELYNMGFTNIVERPTRNGGELKNSELDAGVSILEAKIWKNRPEAVCIVGKSIWESVWRVRHRRGIKKEEFRYGWQEQTENMGCFKPESEGESFGEVWEGAKVFVACSTSGLAATLLPAEKERIWRELGVWVEERRKESATVKRHGTSPRHQHQ